MILLSPAGLRLSTPLKPHCVCLPWPGMVHPSTGYMVSRVLGAAPLVADAIIDQLSSGWWLAGWLAGMASERVHAAARHRRAAATAPSADHPPLNTQSPAPPAAPCSVGQGHRRPPAACAAQRRRGRRHERRGVAHHVAGSAAAPARVL